MKPFEDADYDWALWPQEKPTTIPVVVVGTGTLLPPELEEVRLRRTIDQLQAEIAGLRNQVACLERQLAESDEATKRAWCEAGLAEG